MKWKTMTELSFILLGTAVTALSYYTFMRPNHIIAPGMGGVVILIGQFIPLSLGTLYFLLNIPLFLVGYKYVGVKFVLYSLIGMSSMSLFLSLFEKIPGLEQPFIGCIFGGILSGAPIALVLHAGGSTGGIDIAGVVINKFWPNWTIGKIIFWLNLFLIVISGILYGILQLLLTILSMYIASKSLDVCYEYGNRRKKKELRKSKISV